VSSSALTAEFLNFEQFCRELSRLVWEEVRPERILVVPGNHDVTWLDDGTADRMAAFERVFNKDEVCVTPFGTPNASFAGGKVTVERFRASPTSAPIAVVWDREKGLQFVLMISGYFSGEVPKSVREALRGRGRADEEFLSLLREDAGGVNKEYVYSLSKTLAARESPALGVMHHNPIQYGIETCENRLAPQRMETLWKRRVPILLHGHVHLSESRANQRPVLKGEAYPVPAPTLCSIPTGGSGRGLMVHFVSDYSMGRRIMDTVVWHFSESMSFNAADAARRYRFLLWRDDLEVKHF